MNFDHQLRNFVAENRHDIQNVQRVFRTQRRPTNMNIQSLTSNNTVKNYLQSKPELLSKVRTLASDAHNAGKITESQLEQINSYLA